MKNRSYKCGGCQHWIKSKELGCGICELKDCRKSGDSSCEYWKAIPYKR